MVKQDFSTLAELLDLRAATAPDQVAYTFLQDGVTPSDRLTYGELGRRAHAVAASLRESAAPGDRALLLHPPGLDFIVALFACFEAGIITVPAYPPGRRGFLQLEAIFRDARPAVVLTTDTIAAGLPDGVLQDLGTDESRLRRHGNVVCVPTVFAGTTEQATERYALLQYTSGSTSTPKGVMVSDHNLIANSAVIRSAFDLSPSSISVSWLPAYHDMGLIDGILQPIHTGFPAYLMPPTAFLKAPVNWLKAISRYRATHSGGPNFAYTLCAERIAVTDRQDLDLSCWLSAYNGAEPIRPDTLTDFAKAFTPHGFRPRAFYPCYGLAEATLMVTGVGLGTGARSLHLDGDELSETGTARETEPGAQSVELVSSGRVHGDVRVRVVDPVSRVECGPGQVGEIWVAGTSIPAGYWNLQEQTEETFGGRIADPHPESGSDDGSGDGPYLRTGDLGFLDADDLFVTGRLKDLIIIRGRNYYPQDLERTVELSDPAVRTGCAAAFAVPGPDSEQLVVVCELTPEASADLDAPGLVQVIRRSIRERHGLPIGAVCLLPTGRVPKTSSGKIRRRESRTRYLDGTLGELYQGVFTPRDTPSTPAVHTRETLLSVPEQERKAWLTTYVMDSLADPDEEAPAQSSPETTLIDQGIDSLAAASLAHRMSTELAVPVSLTVFLDNSTVEEVAQHLLDLTTAAQTISTRTEAGTAAGPDRPLSAGEQALWFLHTADPASPAYNTCYAARLPEHADLTALHTALNSLSARHAALRTTFHAVDGRPRAVVHDTLPIPVVHDRAEARTLDSRITDFRDRPFDLENGPLVRATIIATGEDQWVLVLAAHHIVVDLWSLRVLVEDLQAAYAGQEPKADGWELCDYTRWTADRISGAEGERQWRYWSAQLADAPTVFTLPYDRPRPAVRGDAGAVVDLPLDDELLDELRTFAKKSGVTLYTLLLAAYQVLLHRYSGSTDFVIGTPSAARTRPELASLVGYLANQLVLRTRMADDPTFTEHLGRARETVLGALAHQEFPFPLLVERLKPTRDPSHTPLFQVMFAYEKTPSTTGSQLPLDTLAVQAGAARFDLTLVCVEQDSDVTLRWEYSTELFDHDTIERIGRHFRSLLTEIVRDTEQPIGSMRILSDTEQRRALLDWNDTARPVGDACLHQLVLAHATTTPDAVAVRHGTTELTYGELDRRAHLLADRLALHGIGPGALVAVCLRRSPDLVVALLAVLRRGAAFVPVDPTHPDRRIAHMLDDTHAAAVLTHREVRDRVPDHDLVLCVDDHADQDPAEPATTPDADPDALAYVLYTSGSTGAPKGVAISHRSIVNYLTWATREYRISDGAGAPVSSSVTFDATLTSLFGPLVGGRTVTLLSEHAEINELRDLLLDGTRQSLVKATPSQLDLLRAVLPANAGPVNVGALVVGGEAFPAESLEFWRRQSPDMRIYNEYGPTEATVGCCVYEASAHPPHPRGVPIGTPITNAEIYVLDSSLNITPVGVPGEIHIGGTGLARGYLNRPDATAERFIPHPFRDAPDARLYRTGDRARYLPDGTVEYLGRDDEQIKIRGVRVEPGEIEALLLEHPAVHEAAVTASDSTSIDRRLTAHVAAGPGTDNELDAQLRSHLAERLPSVMVPTAFLLTRTLPRTPHGKVDRTALQRIALPTRTNVPTTPALTELEHVIATVWREVLQTDEVSVHENFFDLGGTSALAAEIQARLSNALDREISLVTLFQHATIGSLARFLTGAFDGTASQDAATDRAQRRARALQRRNRT
ncbi:amino acid adenylation domain-containing protein [Streptomyces sp. NPDC000070]|uniref:amino acid adenylation domain-containing protein n=1 Tax=Streptomyces sp. NPDC000070 TaxID=3154240 RepID=UPI003330DBB1